MVRKIIIILVVLVMSSNIASAGIFDDIMQSIQKIVPQKTSIMRVTISTTQPEDAYSNFMDMMYLLNTPVALQNLNKEAVNYDTNSLKVIVTKIPNSNLQYTFYVTKNMGVMSNYNQWGQDSTDKQIVLTYQQVMKMYPYFIDGKIDFLERWQLLAIYKIG